MNLSALFLLSAIGAVGLGGLTARTPVDVRDPVLQKPKREEPIDRTTPRLQRMTPAQREHARLHALDSSRKGGTRILDEKISIVISSDYGPPADLRPASSVVASMTCRADAVFSGVVTRRESFPTEDGTMLFTDSTVLIGDVFRNTFEQPLGALPVTITRLGGSVSVDGVTVSANLSAYPPLEIQSTYLFFVEFVPGHKTFHAKDAAGVWEIRNGRVWPLSRVLVSEGNVMADGLDVLDVVTWLRDVRCP